METGGSVCRLPIERLRPEGAWAANIGGGISEPVHGDTLGQIGIGTSRMVRPVASDADNEGMRPALIALLIAVVFVGVPAWVALAHQRVTKVTDPTGESFRVQAGPTGMPWVARTNLDGSQLLAWFFWLRYLRRHPRTWSCGGRMGVRFDARATGDLRL